LGRNKDKTETKQSWPLWRWLLTGLNLLALVLSAIMSWHYITGGSMAGCGGGSPCELVLSSKWSAIGGIIPISGLAMGLYLALLVAGFFTSRETEAPVQKLAWSTILIMAGAIAGSAIWFTILQKWAIGNFCPYCMTTHITGLIIAVIIVRQALIEFREARSLKVLRLTAYGLVLAVIMAVGQVIITPKTEYRDGESQSNLSAMDYKAVPIVGSPDAKYIVTLLFDYQCPHCQRLHFMLDEVVERYKGKLAFAVSPCPLSKQCNQYIPYDVDAYKYSCELARIGMAVWYADHSAFAQFQIWMFTFDSGDRWRPRLPEDSRNKAIELIGKDKFDAAFNNPWINQYIQSSVQIYGQTIQNGKGGVPRLVYNSRWVIPEPYSADELIATLQESLGIPKP
jgi:uncharacterized membrane protein/protein-disulfide isomerase